MLERVEEFFRYACGCTRPNVNYFIVSFTIRYEAATVLREDLIDTLLRFRNDIFFLLRHFDIGKADRQSAARCVTETEVFQLVEKFRRLQIAGFSEDRRDNLDKAFLIEQLVNETDLVWHDLVEDDTAGRRLEKLAVDTYLDRRVQSDASVVVGDDCFLRLGENHPVTQITQPRLCQVIAAQHLILRRSHDGCTRGG